MEYGSDSSSPAPSPLLTVAPTSPATNSTSDLTAEEGVALAVFFGFTILISILGYKLAGVAAERPAGAAAAAPRPPPGTDNDPANVHLSPSDTLALPPQRPPGYLPATGLPLLPLPPAPAPLPPLLLSVPSPPPPTARALLELPMLTVDNIWPYLRLATPSSRPAARAGPDRLLSQARPALLELASSLPPDALQAHAGAGFLPPSVFPAADLRRVFASVTSLAAPFFFTLALPPPFSLSPREAAVLSLLGSASRGNMVVVLAFGGGEGG
ncbi:hypothetical protein TeGR_g4707, partial [Tetraparma gracilis]